MGGNNKKPFWAGNKPKAQPMPQAKRPIITIGLTFDPNINRIGLEASTNDWTQIEGILIDALSQAFKNRNAAEREAKQQRVRGATDEEVALISKGKLIH